MNNYPRFNPAQVSAQAAQQQHALYGAVAGTHGGGQPSHGYGQTPHYATPHSPMSFGGYPNQSPPPPVMYAPPSAGGGGGGGTAFGSVSGVPTSGGGAHGVRRGGATQSGGGRGGAAAFGSVRGGSHHPSGGRGQSRATPTTGPSAAHQSLVSEFEDTESPSPAPVTARPPHTQSRLVHAQTRTPASAGSAQATGGGASKPSKRTAAAAAPPPISVTVRESDADEPDSPMTTTTVDAAASRGVQPGGGAAGVGSATLTVVAETDADRDGPNSASPPPDTRHARRGSADASASTTAAAAAAAATAAAPTAAKSKSSGHQRRTSDDRADEPGVGATGGGGPVQLPSPGTGRQVNRTAQLRHIDADSRYFAGNFSQPGVSYPYSPAPNQYYQSGAAQPPSPLTYQPNFPGAGGALSVADIGAQHGDRARSQPPIDPRLLPPMLTPYEPAASGYAGAAPIYGASGVVSDSRSPVPIDFAPTLHSGGRRGSLSGESHTAPRNDRHPPAAPAAAVAIAPGHVTMATPLLADHPLGAGASQRASRHYNPLQYYGGTERNNAKHTKQMRAFKWLTFAGVLFLALGIGFATGGVGLIPALVCCAAGASMFSYGIHKHQYNSNAGIFGGITGGLAVILFIAVALNAIPGIGQAASAALLVGLAIYASACLWPLMVEGYNQAVHGYTIYDNPNDVELAELRDNGKFPELAPAPLTQADPNSAGASPNMSKHMGDDAVPMGKAGSSATTLAALNAAAAAGHSGGSNGMSPPTGLQRFAHTAVVHPGGSHSLSAPPRQPAPFSPQPISGGGGGAHGRPILSMPTPPTESPTEQIARLQRELAAAQSAAAAAAPPPHPLPTAASHAGGGSTNGAAALLRAAPTLLAPPRHPVPASAASSAAAAAADSSAAPVIVAADSAPPPPPPAADSSGGAAPPSPPSAAH